MTRLNQADLTTRRGRINQLFSGFGAAPKEERLMAVPRRGKRLKPSFPETRNDGFSNERLTEFRSWVAFLLP